MQAIQNDRFGAKRDKAAATNDQEEQSSSDDILIYDDDDDDDDDSMGLYPPPQTSRSLSSQQLSLLRSLPSNNTCIECNSLSTPDWASVTYGIVLCLDCAGIHRGLGVHLSFVRSLSMDDWTDDQYLRMVQGGNAKWREYWDVHGGICKTELSDESLSDGQNKADDAMDREEFTRMIRFKYESNAARAYREALSLKAKACRLRDDGCGVVGPSSSAASTPAPSPFEGEIRLSEESPPTIEELHKDQAWPFALAMFSSLKARACLLAWGVLGISSAYGVHWWGLYRNNAGGNITVTSSLPSVNPVAHGYMGASIPPNTSNTYYNLFALAILALNVGIPYYVILQFANKIANGLLNNRQDSFKSARNLLKDRIALGRAQRMKRCDVYYPAIPEGGEHKAKCGLIFYPGALVERTAYAPIATRLSEMGILVAVANLEPYRVVANLKNYALKEEVMHMLSDSILLGDRGIWTVDEWTIGGHSMGGYLAIVAVANELSSTIKKVVLWGVSSYPDPNSYPYRRTLREIKDVNAIVINGSNDELVKSTKFGKDKFIRFEEKMPPISPPSFADVAAGNNRGHTLRVTIEGGNHAGCAHYGPQTFPTSDGIRTITLEQQQRRMAEETANFLFDRSKRD